MGWTPSAEGREDGPVGLGREGRAPPPAQDHPPPLRSQAPPLASAAYVVSVGVGRDAGGTLKDVDDEHEHQVLGREGGREG